MFLHKSKINKCQHIGLTDSEMTTGLEQTDLPQEIKISISLMTLLKGQVMPLFHV